MINEEHFIAHKFNMTHHVHFKHCLEKGAEGWDRTLWISMCPYDTSTLWEHFQDSADESQVHWTFQNPPLVLTGLLVGEQLQNL
jgi:hypothetical protein